MSLMNPSDKSFSESMKVHHYFNEDISLLLLPKPPRKQKYIFCLSVSQNLSLTMFILIFI